jgi:hypothetical protein
MSVQKNPDILELSTGDRTPSDRNSLKSEAPVDVKTSADAVQPTAPALATRDTQRTEAALGDAVLRFLRIRKRPKDDRYDLDAVSFKTLDSARKPHLADTGLEDCHAT